MLGLLGLAAFLLVSLVRSETETLNCIFCKAAIGAVVETPTLFKDIEALLDYLCDDLPSGVKEECVKTVSKLDQIWLLIHHGVELERIFTPFTLCTMVDECTVDCCVSERPEQVHLSYIGDPHTSMGVVWTTQSNVNSVIQYSTGSKPLTASGTTKTYTKGGWNGWLHYVQIYNLSPGTTYSYRVGDGGTSWSDYFSFTTEPLTKPPARVVTIANIGDMGANLTVSGANMNSLKQLVASKSIDFVLHNGDISYADGYQGRWDQFLRDMEPVMANVPYMVSVGNHEVGVIGALGLSIGYIHRFQLPTAQATGPDLSNLYYSWNYANIHFIALDTESDLDITEFTDQQAAWLEADLQNVSRNQTPWIIAYGHRPFYCTRGPKECEDNSFIMRKAVDLFNKYQVDLVLGAHRHNYERLWPIKSDGTPVKTYKNPGAPAYIVNGVGGNREGTDGFGSNVFPGSAARISEWGYGLITVYNDTSLRYTLYKAGTQDILDDVHFWVDHQSL